MSIDKFFKDLQTWVDEGFPEGSYFKYHFAICDNYWKWLEHNGYQPESRTETEGEMAREFVKSGLRANMPFNLNWQDFGDEDHWENEKRLKWLKERANG